MKQPEQPLSQRRWEARTSLVEEVKKGVITAGETYFSPAAPWSLRWDLLDWGEGRKKERKQIRISRDIKGMLFLCLLQDIRGSLLISFWEYFTWGSPHWVSGQPQHLKCYTHTSPHPVSSFLCALPSAAMRAGGVIGVVSDKQIRVCGQGRHHKLELYCQLPKNKKRRFLKPAWWIIEQEKIQKLRNLPQEVVRRVEQIYSK